MQKNWLNQDTIYFTYWTDYDKEMPWGVEKNEQIQLEEELLQNGVRVSSMELDLTRNDAPKRAYK